MSAWTPDELGILAAAQSLHLVAGDDDRQQVELGMVTVGEKLYVRAFRGIQSAWFSAAVARGHGRIRTETLRSDVLFNTADPASAAQVDAAYREKYPGASNLVTNPAARAATLQITPSSPS